MQHNKDGGVKLFDRFGLFSFSILFTCSVVYGQSFADFKRVQSESFTQFKDEKDKEFYKYLQSQWQEYKASISASMYEKPKPKVIPTLSEKNPPKVGPSLLINTQPSHLKELTLQTNKEIKEYNTLFDFYGTTVGFHIDTKIKNANFYPKSQKGIANFFTVMAASDYDSIVHTISVTCKEMHLNDWGAYLLVDKLAYMLFVTPDNAKLFSWFLFNKLGYKVKVALDSDKHIVILHAIKGKMYATPNYRLDGKNFYVISQYNKSHIGTIYTYKEDYPQATKFLDFTLKTLPVLAKNLQTKMLSFREYGKLYTVTYKYNKNLLDFMKSYPQVDYKVFFNAPLAYETYRDIAMDIKKYTDGKKASEALNFVLRFVQKAFGYQRDDEQFGREKVMFAQETLYYDKSDCEDRAVLYARLVKDLFGISVVGVKYKDHMSTALHVPLQGDSVKVAGQRYVIADATYINASLGQNIPKYKSIIPDSFIYVK